MTQLADISTYTNYLISKSKKELCAFENCNSAATDRKTGCCSVHSNYVQKFTEENKPIMVGKNEINYIYFILARENNKVKIGKAACPEHRIKQLQTSSPARLELICFF